MSTKITIALLAISVVVFFTAAAIKLSVWHECRTQHSWFYCFTVIG